MRREMCCFSLRPAGIKFPSHYPLEQHGISLLSSEFWYFLKRASQFQGSACSELMELFFYLFVCFFFNLRLLLDNSYFPSQRVCLSRILFFRRIRRVCERSEREKKKTLFSSFPTFSSPEPPGGLARGPADSRDAVFEVLDFRTSGHL